MEALLYEETLTSRSLQVILLVPMVSMLAGLYATYQAGEGVEMMLAITIAVTVIIIDLMRIRIEINESELRIRGILGLIVRKTISIENIVSFRVGESWASCSGFIHFNLPAKGCITIHQKKGWTVSFTTNNPEEVTRVLTTLGVPREP